MNVTCEEMIELLKHKYPTVRFIAGSVGFVIRYHNGNQAVFPYAMFQDPNFEMSIVHAITLLETSDMP